MLQGPIRRASRAFALFAPALAMTLVCLPQAAALATGSDRPALTNVQVAPEGRLVRVKLLASVPIEAFEVSRQGPPNDRDLVIDLTQIAESQVAPPAEGDAREPGVTYAVTTRDGDGHPFVRVVLDRAGDSLVRLDHSGGSLSVLLIPQEPSRTRSADAYRIGPDDVLAISVFGHDDLSKTMKVSPDGLINFPLIGNVKADGRTVDDVAMDIQERLATNFLVDPHVTVSVWEYLSQWVNVIGAVVKPGRYYMTGPMTVIDAISQAGGVTPAAGDTIQVSRRAQQSDPSSAGEVISISARSLLSEGGSAVVRLRPGDVVNVLTNQKTEMDGRRGSSGKDSNR